jgi:hypothetical protein
MINHFTCTCSAFSTFFYRKETGDAKGSHMVQVIQCYWFEFSVDEFK